MKKSNLELLGLSEGATEEEIKDAYSKLRAKYLEDRFKDGEEGNEAARMLTRLDTAYAEIMSELAESNSENGGTSFEELKNSSARAISRRRRGCSTRSTSAARAGIICRAWCSIKRAG